MDITYRLHYANIKFHILTLLKLWATLYLPKIIIKIPYFSVLLSKDFREIDFTNTNLMTLNVG
jgi:hypothetical protein